MKERFLAFVRVVALVAALLQPALPFDRARDSYRIAPDGDCQSTGICHT